MNNLKELTIEEIQKIIDDNDIDLLVTPNLEALTNLKVKGWAIYVDKLMNSTNLHILGIPLVVFDNTEYCKENLLFDENNAIGLTKYDTYYQFYSKENNFPVFVVKIKN